MYFERVFFFCYLRGQFWKFIFWNVVFEGAILKMNLKKKKGKKLFKNLKKILLNFQKKVV